MALQRCLIVEDQVMFLQLLAKMLETYAELELVGTAGDVHSGLQALRDLRPDLLIVDLALPDGDGTELLRFLRLANPLARAVVLSAQAAAFVCPAELEPMLLGVVDKTATFESLQRVLESSLPAASSGIPAPRALTPRQQEIFELIGRGCSNKEIAQQTGLSLGTVETHRKAISRRLGRSGAELVRFAALHPKRHPERP
jgi:DNA-binding NarL/FixJ family response regulator